MNKALLSSQNTNWCTPQDFFDRLDAEFHFVLDAAATDKSAKCRKYYTPETDGLKQSWDCKGAVFCNPPYGRKIREWVKKAFVEAKSGTTIVLLIPARTDTTYFHDYIYGKAEIRFIRGRLRFTDECGSPKINRNGKPMPAPFPSMVVIYNSRQRKEQKWTALEERAMNNDLISRSALKAYIKENGHVDANTLDTFPAAEVGKWISVKDREPEGEYFAYLEDKKAVIIGFNDE